MNVNKQRGGLILGLILGVLIGLAAALAVAVYVTKVPVPFLNKNATRGSDQDEAEAQRNKNWDPNATLHGKNPAKTTPASTPSDATTAPPAVTGTVTPAPAPTPAPTPSASSATPSTATASAPKPAASSATQTARPAPSTTSSDPLGDLARARAAAAPAPTPAPTTTDPFDYFVQAGVFSNQSNADAQRAKLAMLGWEARVSEREQSGRTVFRVRIGPFGKRDDADSLKGKLDGAGIDTTLVRVQR
ncbi:SPOR domain-containing protein [Diaphorobacter sp. HDW4B]|uniref:SPOR domain-containing protein n=1 Tax=Diaphorobacter sp. HDW4B TaxID=2714925 RepID=UPI00140BAD31|nr:SPOR domain-containing protein [Diaphorobacter sp. HDW4B]QIL70487.1 SPOR domain-containing protein [Diaphorobacter sp. HDW4B]